MTDIMATSKPTKKQKEDLVQTLKFTPRTYRIELGAYGGECYFGRVDRKIYDFFKQHKIDMEEYASGWDEEAWEFIPEEMRPFPPGSPWECDGMIHASGPSLDVGNYVTVYDENNEEVFQCELTIGDLENVNIEANCWESECIEDLPDGTVVFWGGQGEKGLCYGGEFELRAPFDPAKLKINYADADGWCIVNGVEYDGEDVENNDYSTTGKWGENKWIIVGDTEEVYEGVSREDMEDEDVPVLEGEEEWAQKAIDEPTSFETLARTLAEQRNEGWNGTDTKPTAKGEYMAKFTRGVWPMGDERVAEWTGRSWKENGKKAPEMTGWREIEEE